MDDSTPRPADDLILNESFQTDSTDIQSGPPKKKRMLSEKQMAALKRGREKRWQQMNSLDELPPESPQLMRTQRTYESEHDDVSQHPTHYNEEFSSSESSSEDEATRKMKKAYKLKKSIPRPIRKRLDKYIKMKLEESLSNNNNYEGYDEPEVLLPPHEPPKPFPYVRPEKNESPIFM